MRRTICLLTLLAGLALAVAGFTLAAPIGPLDSPAISDPTLPFAPALFVLGVILLFASAIVYELFPGRR